MLSFVGSSAFEIRSSDGLDLQSASSDLLQLLLERRGGEGRSFCADSFDFVCVWVVTDGILSRD